MLANINIQKDRRRKNTFSVLLKKCCIMGRAQIKSEVKVSAKTEKISKVKKDLNIKEDTSGESISPQIMVNDNMR